MTIMEGDKWSKNHLISNKVEENNNDIMIKIDNLCKDYKMFSRKRDRLLETILPWYEKHGTFSANKDINLAISSINAAKIKQQRKLPPNWPVSYINGNTNFNNVSGITYLKGLIGLSIILTIFGQTFFTLFL